MELPKQNPQSQSKKESARPPTALEKKQNFEASSSESVTAASKSQKRPNLAEDQAEASSEAPEKKALQKAGIQEGMEAPDFTLPATPDQTLSLHEFRGQPVVLVFYPADWSPVCGDQLALYNEIYPDLKKRKVAIVGISVDSIWCHMAYTKDRKFQFPIVADFHPKGKVAKAYGIYDEGHGVCSRALFLVDANGLVRWSYVSPMAINPGADGFLDALDQLDEDMASAQGKVANE